jgi:hypothetical protein
VVVDFHERADGERISAPATRRRPACATARRWRRRRAAAASCGGTRSSPRGGSSDRLMREIEAAREAVWGRGGPRVSGGPAPSDSRHIGTSRRLRLPVPLAVTLGIDDFPKSAQSIAVCHRSRKGSSA